MNPNPSDAGAALQTLEYASPRAGSRKLSVLMLSCAVVGALTDIRNLFYWNEYAPWEIWAATIFIISWLTAIVLAIALRAKQKNDRLLKQITLGLIALELIALTMRQ